MERKKQRNNKTFRYWPISGSVFLWLYLLSACATTSAPSPTAEEDSVEGRVVERSKAEPPSWIKKEPGNFHALDNELSFHVVKTKMANLPLGIKQAQLAAIGESELALGNLAAERIKTIAKNAGIALTEGAEQDLKKHIEVATKKYHGEYLKIVDIYYERIEVDGNQEPNALNEFYTAFVNVSFPKLQFVNLMNDVGRRLVSSSAPELRELSRQMSSAVATDLSH